MTLVTPKRSGKPVHLTSRQCVRAGNVFEWMIMKERVYVMKQ